MILQGRGTATLTSDPEQLLRRLSLDSTLQELDLHNVQVELSSLGNELTRAFERNPLLPGILLTERGKFQGMLSRRKFLEIMSRPYSLELFSKRPLSTLYPYIHSDLLICSHDLSIVEAARQCLRRSPESLYEPIVVELENSDCRLLDAHHLQVAQAHIHELTMQKLREQTRAEMMQAEKMVSLGKMVAGLAHEIANPVNFIAGNVECLSNYTEDLMALLAAYDEESATPSTRVQELLEDVDLDFLKQDMPEVLNGMKVGAELLQKIVSSLRNFSHVGERQKRAVEVSECIESVLLILHNRLKYNIELAKYYQPVPPVRCYSGQLSQVFMNLVGNAADALMDKVAEVKAARKRGESVEPWEARIDITVQAREAEGRQWAIVTIADNGPGIPPDIQQHIFEMFFTTKPIGKGTGIGLAISHQIVTETHGGRLELRSQVGVGTEFEVWLPLE